MREAEQHYKQIDENQANSDGIENVKEDGEASDGQEEEKKEESGSF